MYSKYKYESVTKQILLKVQYNHTINIVVPRLKLCKEHVFWAKVVPRSDSHFCFQKSCISKWAASFEPFIAPHFLRKRIKNECKLQGSGAWPCYFKFPSSLRNHFDFVFLEHFNLACSWFEAHNEKDAVCLYYSKFGSHLNDNVFQFPSLQFCH